MPGSWRTRHPHTARLADKRVTAKVSLRRRKVEDGAYDIVDQTGAVVARVEEWGVRGYRWRVIPTDRSIRSWDTTSITLAIHDLSKETQP